MKYIKFVAIAAVMFFVVEAIYPQEPIQVNKAPGVDAKMQKEIDKAIDKATKWLLKNDNVGDGWHGWEGGPQFDELVLYTLINADIKTDHPKVVALLDAIISRPPSRTYTTALEAMALNDLLKKEKKDKQKREKYLTRLIECGQFLIDNQGQNGQWGYGGPVPPLDPKEIKKFIPQKEDTGVATEPLKRRRWGRPNDNSNSQYAALGLRAVMEQGIKIPKDTMELAVKWFETAGVKEGESTGWGYQVGRSGPACYGSMTAGAVGALVIYKYWLYKLYKVGNKDSYKNDPTIKAGLNWIAKNFDVATNPGGGADWADYHYYWLYGLERAGKLSGEEKMGKHLWYKEGAEYLLKNQQADGRWNWPGVEKDPKNKLHIVNTCFALLFLKRATGGIVPTQR